jgi:flagellar biosynthesis protein FliR
VTFELTTDAISGYLLALVRAAAWVAVSPPFGTRMVPVQVKVGFAAALSLALGPKLAAHGVPLEAGPLISAAVLQLGAGLALGFLAVLLFSAVQAAGNLIDLFSGLTMASVLDPMTSSTAAVFGRFYQLLATTLLFAINGHVMLVRGFLTSFEAAPLTSLDLATMGQLLTQDLAMFFLAAIEIAAPLLAALFLAEVVLGLLARAAPQMNVFVVGMPFKILVTLTLAGLAVPLLPGAIENLVTQIVRDGFGLMGA